MILTKLSLFSKCLARLVEVNVLLPQTMWEKGKEAEEKEYPTLYLLHGYGDNHTAWQRWTNIERYAGQHNMIVIMPAAERSWYTDTQYGDAFFTFITEELPALCKRMFRGVSSCRETTFVGGLSMGGYGALKIGLRYPHRYRGIAAFSPVADIMEVFGLGLAPTSYFESVFGNLEQLSGSENDLFFLAEQVKRSGAPLPRIYLWCGTEDRLSGANYRFADHLKALEYPLSAAQTAGNHSWPYWDREVAKAIPYLLEADK